MSWFQNQNDRKPRNNYFVKIEHPQAYIVYTCNLCVLVGDNRANNFDTYSQPQDLNIHYIIQRGATVDILTDLTCSFLYSHETNLDNYQVILVKLSAGIIF